MLKNILAVSFLLGSFLFAEPMEVCNLNNDPSTGFPNGTCSYQFGYICGLAYDMPSNGPTGYNHNLNFYIGNDPTCSVIAQTSIFGGTDHQKLRIFYYEDPNEYADALNMSVVTSFVLSAANNRYPVNVIYKKIAGTKKEFFLVAIQQVNSYNVIR